MKATTSVAQSPMMNSSQPQNITEPVENSANPMIAPQNIVVNLAWKGADDWHLID